MEINICKTCGYKGQREHNHLYDCADYLEPNWMKDWIKRSNKNGLNHTTSNFVKWSSRFHPLLILFSFLDY